MNRPTLARPAVAPLLDALLSAPDLVRELRALPGPAVVEIVHQVGLEDSGEILSLLTTDQLTELLDDVLWDAAAAGADETFEPGRFVTWLEVMLEAGDDFVADRLAELSEDLLTLAVSRLALVLDLVEVEAGASDRSEGELVEKALDSTLYQELGDYFLVARSHDGWDAFVAALVALDARHADVLERTLHRAWTAAHEQLDEAGGLYELLTALDVLEIDAAAEREDRRAALGYVAPATARAFLGLASQPSSPSDLASHDPVTRAYFRELDVAKVRRHRVPVTHREGHVVELLRGVVDGGVGPDASAPRDHHPLRDQLAELALRDAERHARAVEELAFLTNVLVAGDASRGRPWRPAEAAERVLEVCEAGLERLPHGTTELPLHQWSLVAAFRAGWASPLGAPR